MEKLFHELVTKQYLLDNPNVIFVFGDNLERIGYGGAAALRDMPNTYGFITKKAPDNKPSSFYKPSNYKDVFDKELALLKDKIKANPNKTFLISKLGAGLANKYYIFEEVIEVKIKEVLSCYDNVKFLW